MAYKERWIALGVVLVPTFAVWDGVGVKVLTSAPPISESLVTAVGRGIR
jgi:nitric oxide reductase large subunit